MTRINVGISPKELPDKLLLAEHREITRIPNAISSNRAVIIGIPKDFKLGQGHVKFFYNKIKYLFNRYVSLYEECMARGFKVTDKSSAFDENKIRSDLWKDYKELPDDRNIVVQRIESKGFKLLNELRNS